MNVDHEDELRIQAPPGAASASESWLQLDGTGMMPEAQERKRKTIGPAQQSQNDFGGADPVLARSNRRVAVKVIA